MVVIVTGCAGFLGSHLSKYYINRGSQVLGIDDFSSSNERSKHFRELLISKQFSFIEGAVENVETMRDARHMISYLQRDNAILDEIIILNFACPASPPRYQSMPMKTLDTCFNGTKNVLELTKHLNAKVVHASTSEIYGDPVNSPQVETDWGNVNSFGFRSTYDEGKRVSETLCFEAIQSGQDVRLVRIFNTFGPNMDKDDGRVVTNFIKQALNGERLTIYGDGSQTRSFCYVDDLIRGIVLLAEKQRDPRLNFPLNLGNPNEFSMLELATRIKSLINSESVVKFEPLPSDDPRQRCPNISKAKELLDWSPIIELEEGLKRTIKAFYR